MRLVLVLLLALPLAACGGDATPGASGETTAATAAPEAASGDLSITGAMTVAAPAGQTGGAFMTITGGATADTLVAARFAGTETVEVHESYETDEGLRDMRKVPGVPVPAGETVALRPGGYHLMLINLAEPLAVGDSIDVEVEMAQAGTVPVRVAVRPVEEVGVEEVRGE